MTVLRVGTLVQGKFVPSPEGGVHHRQGGYAQKGDATTYDISGERISISLLGDEVLVTRNVIRRCFSL
jgi:hypothetical protein